MMTSSLFKSKIKTYFKFVRSSTGEQITLEEQNLNVIILNGESRLNAQFKDNTEVMIHPFSMKLFCPYTEIKLSSTSRFEVILLFFDYVGKYCDEKICSYLESEKPVYTNKTGTLSMDETMKSYYHLMQTLYSGFTKDKTLWEIKYKELFFILCTKLKIEDFAQFLHPAMTWFDPVFRRKVLDHFDEDYRVKSLAYKCGYTYNEFRNKFQEEFKTLPSVWMKEQMMDVIRERIIDPCIQFKDLADLLKMQSVQQFTRFCKTNFNKTPTELRRQLLSRH